MRSDKLEKIIAFLVTCVLGLGVVIYQELKTNQKDITAILQKHEQRITDLERDVAVIKATANFFDNSGKKKPITCNFKVYAIVNAFSQKKKSLIKEDSEESDYTT